MSGTWTPGPGATSGNDSYVGTGGSNWVAGQAGDDTLLGEGGGDVLFGDTGNDSLVGGSGGDIIYGGDGNDVINGGTGDDLLIGGSGADTFFYNEGDGSDTIFGGQGADQVFVYAPGGYTSSSSGLFTQLTFTATGQHLYVNSASIHDSPVPLPCFAQGTAIMTARGEVPVEQLRVGDLVVATARGQTSLQPIAWIGRSNVAIAAHPRPEAVAPIRISAGALAAGVPARDLRVSPEHALHIDGWLVPARLLVNGDSIVQEMHAPRMTYWHVELPAHAVVIAEGTPAESYLEDGNRGNFDNAGVVALVKDFTSADGTYAARACAPLLLDGPALDAMRRRIVARQPDAPAEIRRRA